MVRRRLSLPFTDVIEDDEVIADEEINKRKWKSYHEIDVKQNMGYGRYIHKIIQNNYNAKIFWITMAAVPTNLIVLNGNLEPIPNSAHLATLPNKIRLSMSKTIVSNPPHPHLELIWNSLQISKRNL